MRTPTLKPDKLPAYLHIIADKKKTTADSFSLRQNPNQKKWKIAEIDLIAQTLKDEILSMLIEERQDGRKYFVKIKAPELSESPCFRFDSDGPSHPNRFDDIPLPQRSVPTPHFQRFDDKGRWVAYRTEEIEKQGNEAVFRVKLESGLRHFCEESLIALSSGSGVLVQTQQIPLFDVPPTDDPLNGVTFS